MKNTEMTWAQSLPAAITVCDRQGVIIFMNDQADRTFAKQGGRQLIGKSLFDCHSPASQQKIKHLMETGSTNTYTIEKGEMKKLIFQSPWFESGAVAGMVEISIVLPAEMPHFVRPA